QMECRPGHSALTTSSLPAQAGTPFAEWCQDSPPGPETPGGFNDADKRPSAADDRPAPGRAAPGGPAPAGRAAAGLSPAGLPAAKLPGPGHAAPEPLPRHAGRCPGAAAAGRGPGAGAGADAGAGLPGAPERGGA